MDEVSPGPIAEGVVQYIPPETSSESASAPSSSEAESAKKSGFLDKRREKKEQRRQALEDENPIAIHTTRSEHRNVGGAGERFDHTKKSEPKDRVIPTEELGIRKSVVEAHKIFLKEDLKQHLELRNANVLNPEYNADELALIDAFVKE